MNNQPLVSVIIPTYDGEKYIAKAIESVLGQSYWNTEIIVIDDGSTDKTPEIISEFSREDSRIVIIRNKTNLGFVKTLNKGIRGAQGKYIARLDDDDSWCDPKKIEKQVGFLEKNPEYALVGGGVIRINGEGKEIIRYLFPEKNKDIRKSILADNLFAHSTVLFRKNVWEKIGGYDKQFGFFADWDLWLKIGRLGKFYNFQEYFTYYLDKEQNGNYSMRNSNIRRKVITNVRLRKKYRNVYPGYRKAFLLCWINYFYSFLPYRQRLRLILIKIRTLIFGLPSYKYFK